MEAASVFHKADAAQHTHRIKLQLRLGHKKEKLFIP